MKSRIVFNCPESSQNIKMLKALEDPYKSNFLHDRPEYTSTPMQNHGFNKAPVAGKIKVPKSERLVSEISVENMVDIDIQPVRTRSTVVGTPLPVTTKPEKIPSRTRTSEVKCKKIFGVRVKAKKPKKLFKKKEKAPDPDSDNSIPPRELRLEAYDRSFDLAEEISAVLDDLTIINTELSLLTGLYKLKDNHKITPCGVERRDIFSSVTPEDILKFELFGVKVLNADVLTSDPALIKFFLDVSDWIMALMTIVDEDMDTIIPCCHSLLKFSNQAFDSRLYRKIHSTKVAQHLKLYEQWKSEDAPGYRFWFTKMDEGGELVKKGIEFIGKAVIDEPPAVEELSRRVSL